jgi:hypothetical protein
MCYGNKIVQLGDAEKAATGMKRATKDLYAVVRVDDWQLPDVPWTNRITVKEILTTEQEARTEVERLNKLNGTKNRFYFWQVTRPVMPK